MKKKLIKVKVITSDYIKAKNRVLKKYPNARPVWVLIGWTIWATTKSGYNRISNGCEKVKHAWMHAAKEISLLRETSRVYRNKNNI